jgi:hypothetical protein
MSSPEQEDQPADDEMALRCLRRGWRRRRLGDEVFFYDEKAEYLVRVTIRWPAGASLGDSAQTLLDLAERPDGWVVRRADPMRRPDVVRPYRE